MTRVDGGLYGEIFHDLRMAWRARGVRRYSVSFFWSPGLGFGLDRRSGSVAGKSEPSFMSATPVAVVAAPVKIVPTEGKTMVAPADWSKEKIPPVAPPYMMDWTVAAILPRSC